MLQLCNYFCDSKDDMNGEVLLKLEIRLKNDPGRMIRKTRSINNASAFLSWV